MFALFIARLFDKFRLAFESRDASEHDSNAQVGDWVLAVVMRRLDVLHCAQIQRENAELRDFLK